MTTRTTSAARAGAAAVLLFAAFGGASGAQQPSAPFRAHADLVSVDVTVLQRGRPVRGLGIGDFEVRDNGVPQHVRSLEFEQLPIDLTVALDVSGSVQGSTLDELRRAVHDLTRDLQPHDRLRLLTFNARITRVVDFGAPASEIDAAFQNIRPLGGTAVLDAMAVVLAAPAVIDRRQLAVVFTDGVDGGSVTTPEELIEVARRTTPTLGIVLAALPPRLTRTRPGTETRRKMFGDIAAETGGFVESFEPGESLVSTFRRLLTTFRMSYVVYFAPEGVTRSGAHTLDVRVKRPSVEVRARRAYSAR